MVLGHKCVRRFRCLLFFLTAFSAVYVSQLEASAAGDAASDVLDKTQYPLGGTWRAGFGESYDAVHTVLCKREMAAFAHASQALETSISYNTNVALFELKGKRSGHHEVLTLLKHDDFISSGAVPYNIKIGVDGTIVFDVEDAPSEARESSYKQLKPSGPKDPVTPVSLLIQHVSTIKQASTLEGDIAALGQWRKMLQEKMDGISAEVDKAITLSRHMKAHIDGYPLPTIRAKIHAAEIRDISDAYKHLYDSEQIIMRLVDAYFNQSGIDWSAYSEFTLHLHSRLALCPHCLKCLHARAEPTGYWREKTGVSLKVLVSSRESYISPEMMPCPDAAYYSMNLIGWDTFSSEAFSGERDAQLIERGCVFQMAIPLLVQASLGRQLKEEAAQKAATAAAPTGII